MTTTDLSSYRQRKNAHREADQNAPKRTVQVRSDEPAKPVKAHRMHALRDAIAPDNRYRIAVRMVSTHTDDDGNLMWTDPDEIHRRAVRQIEIWKKKAADEDARADAFRYARQCFYLEHGDHHKKMSPDPRRTRGWDDKAIRDYMIGDYDARAYISGVYQTKDDRDRAVRMDREVREMKAERAREDVERKARAEAGVRFRADHGRLPDADEIDEYMTA